VYTCAASSAFLLVVITPHGRFLHFKRLTIYCFLSETIYTMPMMIDQTALISVCWNKIGVNLLRQRWFEDAVCSFTGALKLTSKLLGKKELLRNDQYYGLIALDHFFSQPRRIISSPNPKDMAERLLIFLYQLHLHTANKPPPRQFMVVYYFGNLYIWTRPCPSEAGLIQLMEFQILDVTPGNTHLCVKSWRVIVLRPPWFQFKNRIQHHNPNAASNARSWQFCLGFYVGRPILLHNPKVEVDACRGHLFPTSNAGMHILL
jgi:hypothetical protein